MTFTLFDNEADPEAPWMRGFMLRLGYMLAAEWHTMPPCDFRDAVGNYAHDLIALTEQDEPEAPTLRAVD